MDTSDILSIRLHTTGLSNRRFTSADSVVNHLGAVQSQDFSAAKWSVGLRMQSATDEVIEEAFNAGIILRTHVMRPTWHFLMPQDIRWMLALTAPQVKKILSPYDRKLNITPDLLSFSQSVFSRALEDKNYLTRTELAKRLEDKAQTAIRGQKLAHLIMHAELDAVICSGPRRGKQFTYRLLDEIAPRIRLNRDDSLKKLALKYFVGHGPAQIKDFAWWSGLSIKDAQRGLDMANAELKAETVEGKTYWFSQKTTTPTSRKKEAYLLSIYDEYLIGYRDRSALGEERHFEKLVQMGNALTAVMVFDGRIVGTWKRRVDRANTEVHLSPFTSLGVEEKEAFEKAVDCYGLFTGSSATSYSFNSSAL